MSAVEGVHTYKITNILNMNKKIQSSLLDMGRKRSIFIKNQESRIKNQESRRKIQECMAAWMHDLTADRRRQTAV
jgi:hypothetical protein